MEQNLIEKLVEQISQSYSSEKQQISEKLKIENYGHLLNVPRIKTIDNMRKVLFEWNSDRFEIIDGRSFIFLDKFERIMYVYLNENYLKSLLKKFSSEKKLQYILGMVLNLDNELVEEYYQESLFDVAQYDFDPYEEQRKTAHEKYNDFYTEYGNQYDRLHVISKNSSKSFPKISLYEITYNLELIKLEDWTKHIRLQNSNLNNHDVGRKANSLGLVLKNKSKKTYLKDNVKSDNEEKNDSN